MLKAKKEFPKKKDRKALRVARWRKRNCCPTCSCIIGQKYLRRYGQCCSCIMNDIGMSWGDFI